tara:strand:+ start:207 stop:530 length:324 start_codon:yes stop_codon:yes gene_type:complete
MKNYEEKEKNLENALKRLNNVGEQFGSLFHDVSELKIQKNQLISEKQEIETKYEKLLADHKALKEHLDKINNDVNLKFHSQNKFSKKIDELNQETESLIDEIDKWQT